MGHSIDIIKNNFVRLFVSHEGMRIDGGLFDVDIDDRTIGFFNKRATQQSVTGSTDSQKLASLITALKNYGLIAT